MMGDESKNMDNSAGERYRERSEIKVMNDHYCIYFILNLMPNPFQKTVYRYPSRNQRHLQLV